METATTHHGQVAAVLRDKFDDREIVGIELGTAAADLTKTLLAEFPNLRIYTVDPWMHVDGNLFEAGHPQEEHDLVYAHAMNALKEFGTRVAVMRMSSCEAFDKIEEKVDFVWIDGDHMIETVKRDILNGLKAVKPGGILGGHDYPTVLEAINTTLFDFEVHQGADMTWWVYL